MKVKTIFLLSMAFFAALIFSPYQTLGKNLTPKGRQNLSQLGNRPLFMPGKIRIKFKPDVSYINSSGNSSQSLTGISSFDQKMIKSGIRSIKKTFAENSSYDFNDYFGISRIYTLSFSEDKDVRKIAAEFSRSSLVEYAEPIPLHYIEEEPNDPLFNQQDHLFQIQAPQAWDFAKGDSNVVIAIIDGGTDWEHPDLIDNIWSNEAEVNGIAGVDDDGNGYVDDFHGWDFANNDNNPTNQPANIAGYYHGTVTAGLASARTNNNKYVAGVAWNCKIMPLKHGKDDDERYIYHWLSGIQYAVRNGAHIINTSFGSYAPSQVEIDVINDAYSKGVLIVASAGNILSADMHYPSAYEHVLSVSWVHKNDKITSLSAFGISVDVVAPGVDLLSLSPNNSTIRMSGSSSSSPVVAGLAGLLKSQHPEWGPDQITRQIVLTADNIDDKNPHYIGRFGSGRINAYRAVTEIDPPEISPRIKIFNVSFSDSAGGDNDSIYERGETVDVKFSAIHNYSVSPGEDVVFTISSNDTDIIIINGSYELGYVAPDSTMSVPANFSFSVSNNARGKTSQIYLDWHAKGGFSGSDTFNVIVGKIPVLLVDDDRGKYPAEKLYTTIFDQWELNYAFWNRTTDGPLGAAQLANFPIVVWLCEWAFPSLDSLDQIAIANFLDSGGNLFLSGQDIGWDFNDPDGYGYAHRDFYTKYLHAIYFADDSEVNQVVGMPNDPIGDGLQFDVYQPGLEAAYQFPDEIEPADSATSSFEYVGGNNHKFGIKYEGAYKVLYLGTGFEAIDATEYTKPDEISPIRTEVMRRALNWLNFIDFTPISSTENLAESRPVQVSIKESLIGSDVVRMELYWKKENDAEFTKVIMTDDGNGQYSAEIPGPNEITNIHYYFKLVNTYYDWENPAEAPESFYHYYVGPDHTAPTFTHVALTPSINGEKNREFVVGIQDNSNIDTNKVYIHFSSSTVVDSIKLTTTKNPQQFRGYLPPVFSYGDTVRYYFSAFDEANTQNRGTSEIYSFIIGLETFEAGLGNWMVTSNGWGLDDLYAHSGTYSINDSPGQSPYPSNRWAIIMTNFGFDLSHSEHATLEFWTKHYIELNSDYGYVEVSTDGGTNWYQVGEPFNGFKTAWYKETLSLDPFCGPGNDNVKIRFRMTSDATQYAPVPGWFIDDIQLIEGKNVTRISGSNEPQLPAKFALHQNYPNPFNPSTTIRFDLPQASKVSLKIYNIKGELVRTLVDEDMAAGIYQFKWNGDDNQRQSLASGVYFYKLSTPDFSSVKKLLFLK